MVKVKRLLDFCCKAGGTSMGYHMAGFDVTGMDIEPQPHFPFRFQLGDITKISDKRANWMAKNYDAIAASPPCKGFGKTAHLAKPTHPKLIEDARELLDFIGLPYIIENVEGAPLLNPVSVCGSGVGLRVRRHRIFESNVKLVGIECNHQWQERDQRYVLMPNGPESIRRSGFVGVYGSGDGSFFMNKPQPEIWSHAMGIDWMELDELSQAIPPLYTYHLGKQLMEYT